MGERSVAVLQLLVGLAAAFLLVALLTHQDPLGDVEIYRHVAARVAGGELPYADFPLEYPPLALLPMLAPWYFPAPAPDAAAYALRFGVESTILVVAGGLLLAWMARRTRPQPASSIGLLAGYLPLALALAFIGLWRYDLTPAVLSLIALALLPSRPGAAGMALAASIGAKLYAAPLAIPFGAWLLVSRGWRAAGRFAIGCVAVLALLALPFVALGQGMTMTFLRYQAERGLQLETTWAGIIGLGHVLAGVPARDYRDFGTHQLDSPWTGPMLAVAGVALPVLLSVVVVIGLLRLGGLAAQGQSSTTAVAELSAALLLALIVTNKALSPQYLIWLLPFTPLVQPGPRLLLLLAGLLTALLYPFMYDELRALSPAGVALLNARNLALWTSLAWLLANQRPRVLQPALDRWWRALRGRLEAPTAG